MPEVSSVRSAPAPWVSVADRGDRVVGFWIDQRVGAEFLGALEPLGAHIERDDAGAHGGGELRRRQPDRSLADHGNGIAAGEIHAPQRLIGGPGAAGDRRAGGKAERVGQGDERIGGDFHIGRVRAVAGCAIDG